MTNVQSKFIYEMFGDYFHVRPEKSNLDLFMNEMAITNQAKWDKDHKNTLRIGDFIGFIVGKKGEEIVYIYKVKEELPLTERESWWSEKAYTENNGVTSTKHRVPILLTNEHEFPKTWSWSDIKKKVGLSPKCSTWMPRGTQRVVKKHLLPFVNGTETSNQTGLELIKRLYSD